MSINAYPKLAPIHNQCVFPPSRKVSVHLTRSAWPQLQTGCAENNFTEPECLSSLTSPVIFPQRFAPPLMQTQVGNTSLRERAPRASRCLSPPSLNRALAFFSSNAFTSGESNDGSRPLWLHNRNNIMTYFFPLSSSQSVWLRAVGRLLSYTVVRSRAAILPDWFVPSDLSLWLLIDPIRLNAATRSLFSSTSAVKFSCKWHAYVLMPDL